MARYDSYRDAFEGFSPDYSPRHTVSAFRRLFGADEESDQEYKRRMRQSEQYGASTALYELVDNPENSREAYEKRLIASGIMPGSSYYNLAMQNPYLVQADYNARDEYGNFDFVGALSAEQNRLQSQDKYLSELVDRYNQEQHNSVQSQVANMASAGINANLAGLPSFAGSASENDQPLPASPLSDIDSSNMARRQALQQDAQTNLQGRIAETQNTFNALHTLAQLPVVATETVFNFLAGMQETAQRGLDNDIKRNAVDVSEMDLAKSAFDFDTFLRMYHQTFGNGEIGSDGSLSPAVVTASPLDFMTSAMSRKAKKYLRHYASLEGDTYGSVRKKSEVMSSVANNVKQSSESAGQSVFFPAVNDMFAWLSPELQKYNKEMSKLYGRTQAIKAKYDNHIAYIDASSLDYQERRAQSTMTGDTNQLTFNDLGEFRGSVEFGKSMVSRSDSELKQVENAANIIGKNFVKSFNEFCARKAKQADNDYTRYFYNTLGYIIATESLPEFMQLSGSALGTTVDILTKMK